MAASKARVTEVIDYAMIHGEDEACALYGLPLETLNRYKRKYKELYGENADILMALKKQFTDTELKALVRTSKAPAPTDAIPPISFEGDAVKFGLVTDTHIGHKEFDELYLYSAFREFEKQNCQFVLHGGDVTEGLMNRPGHFYECNQYGYKAQRDEAVRVLSDCKLPLYLTLGNHDCLTPESECLTREGWKHYTELTMDDLVYSYDTTTHEGVWKPITDIVIRDHDGEMVRIDSPQIDMTMTPNHRVLCALPAHSNIKATGHRNGQYEYLPAIDLLDKSTTLFKVSASAPKADYPIADALLEAITWIITDGSVRLTASGRAYYMIWQSKDITGILDTLNRAGLGYSIRTRTRNITEICGKKLKKPPLPENKITITEEGVKLLKPYLTAKTMPDWMLELSPRQFELVNAVLKEANGSYSVKRKASTWALYGTREELEKYQILFTVNGRRASIRQDPRGAWKLNICARSTVGLRKHNIKTEYYKGPVWCISTPLTNFLVRCNGSTMFTGNCSYNTKLGAGVDVVEDICEKLPNATYLAGDPSTLPINGIDIRLFHGRDRGGSYAKSNRGQKIVDSFGTDIPAILVTGHDHSAVYCKHRGCHIIDAGCIQKLTDFQKGNKLTADVGFWIITMTIRDGKIVKFLPEWYDLQEASNGA